MLLFDLNVHVQTYIVINPWHNIHMTKLSIVHRHSDQNNKELTPKGVYVPFCHKTN